MLYWIGLGMLAVFFVTGMLLTLVGVPFLLMLLFGALLGILWGWGEILYARSPNLTRSEPLLDWHRKQHRYRIVVLLGGGLCILLKLCMLSRQSIDWLDRFGVYILSLVVFQALTILYLLRRKE